MKRNVLPISVLDFISRNHPGIKNLILAGSNAKKLGTSNDWDIIGFDESADRVESFKVRLGDETLDLLLIPKIEVIPHIRKSFQMNQFSFLQMLTTSVIIDDDDSSAQAAIFFANELIRTEMAPKTRKVNKMLLIIISNSIGDLDKSKDEDIRMALAFKIFRSLIEFKLHQHHPLYINSPKHSIKFLKEIDPSYVSRVSSALKNGIATNNYDEIISSTTNVLNSLGGLLREHSTNRVKAIFRIHDRFRILLPFTPDSHKKILLNLGSLQSNLNQIGCEMAFLRSSHDKSMIDCVSLTSVANEQVIAIVKSTLHNLKFPDFHIQQSTIEDDIVFLNEYGGRELFECRQRLLSTFLRQFTNVFRKSQIDDASTDLILREFIVSLILSLYQSKDERIEVIHALCQLGKVGSISPTQSESILESQKMNESLIEFKKKIHEMVILFSTEVKRIDVKSIRYTDFELNAISRLLVNTEPPIALTILKNVQDVISFFGVQMSNPKTLVIFSSIKFDTNHNL